MLLEYRSLVEANSQKAVVTAWEGCACGETIPRWQFKIESARTASLQPDDSRAGKAQKAEQLKPNAQGARQGSLRLGPASQAIYASPANGRSRLTRDVIGPVHVPVANRAG